MPIRLKVLSVTGHPPYTPIKYDDYKNALDKMPEHEREHVIGPMASAVDAWGTYSNYKTPEGQETYHDLHKGLQILHKHGVIKKPDKPITAYRGLELSDRHPVGETLKTTNNAPLQSWTTDKQTARNYGYNHYNEFKNKVKYGHVLQHEIHPSHYMADIRHLGDLDKHRMKLLGSIHNDKADPKEQHKYRNTFKGGNGLLPEVSHEQPEVITSIPHDQNKAKVVDQDNSVPGIHRRTHHDPVYNDDGYETYDKDGKEITKTSIKHYPEFGHKSDTFAPIPAQHLGDVSSLLERQRSKLFDHVQKHGTENLASHIEKLKND